MVPLTVKERVALVRPVAPSRPLTNARAFVEANEYWEKVKFAGETYRARCADT